MRLGRLLMQDTRLQRRYRFWAAYLFVAVFYVVVLRAVPSELVPTMAPLIIFSEPAVFGLFVVGALMLFERQDGTLAALFVTPVRPWEYLSAKVLALTLLALATSLLIAVAGVGVRFDPVLLMLSVGLTAPMFVGLGAALATRFTQLHSFLFVAGSALGLLYAPALEVVGAVDGRWLAVLPTRASMQLLLAAFGDRALGSGEVIVSTLFLALAAVLGWLWARRWLELYVVARPGG